MYLRGTVQRRIYTNDSGVAKGSCFVIARLRVGEGHEVVVKGDTTGYVEPGDELCGMVGPPSVWGESKEASCKAVGLLEVRLPVEGAAVRSRLRDLCARLPPEQAASVTPAAITALVRRHGGGVWAVLEGWPAGGAAAAPADAAASALASVLPSYVADKFSGVLRGRVEALSGVASFLQALGVAWTAKMQAAAAEFEPTDTVRLLERDPLRFLDVPGLGVKAVGALVHGLAALGRATPDQVALFAVLAALVQAEQEGGHTYVPVSALPRLPSQGVAAASGCPPTAEPKPHVVLYGVLAYRRSMYEAERCVADACAGLCTMVPHLLLCEEGGEEASVQAAVEGAFDGFKATPEQVEGVAMVLREGVSTLQGAAGTGKTTLLRLLLRAVEALVPEPEGAVLLLAPTGKAAQRLRDAVGEARDPTIAALLAAPSATVHRWAYSVRTALAAAKAEGQGGGITPLEDLRCPRLVVVDEATMVDAPTAALLLTTLRQLAAAKGAPHPHLAFVGDLGQLPSVGPGAVFEQLVTSASVPTTMLAYVHRQAGAGGALTEAIRCAREGQGVSLLPASDPSFTAAVCPSPEELKARVLRWCEERVAERGGCPLATAPHLLLACPTRELAASLTPSVRDLLNPGGGKAELRDKRPAEGGGEVLYRVGDRLMQTKNNYERGVFNGSVGVLRELRSVPKPARGADGRAPPEACMLLVLEFEGGGADRHEYTAEAAREELVHAYVLTVHKTQGSEAEDVLFVGNLAGQRMVDRKLVYTALSRAKRSCTALMPQRHTYALWRREPAPRRSALASMLDAALDELTPPS